MYEVQPVTMNPRLWRKGLARVRKQAAKKQWKRAPLDDRTVKRFLPHVDLEGLSALEALLKKEDPK